MLVDLNSPKFKGLTESEANEKLQKEGFNELPSSKPKNILAIAIGIIKEPMFLLLVACGSLYLVLGDLQEGIMLLGFVFVVMGIEFYQEKKTEKALDALKDLASPRALVIRDGEERRIAGREVATGDIVVLQEGDRVPADAAVLNASGGNVPYVWTLVSDGGSGLNLSTAGVLSGLPRRAGTFGLVFSVTDGSATDQSALTLTIAPDDSAVVLNIVTETLPPADGVLYAAIVQAIGGKAPYTWSGDDTSDPGTGFEVDAASGSITGNTTGLLPGEYGYSITVEDSAGGTDVRSYIIEVLGGTGDLQPVTILTANPLPDATQELPDATEGMTYSVVMRTIGGTGSNNTWEVLETIKDDGTAVPAGDGPSFEPPGGSAESGVLFWSAAKITAGNYLVTVRVSSNGADGSADTVTFNLQAVPAP